MAQYQLAQAYVQIVPSLKGVGKAIESAFAGPAKSTGAKAGNTAGSGFSTGFSAKMGAISGIASSVASKVIGVFAGLSGEILNASDSTQKFQQTLAFAKVSDGDIKRLTASTQEYANKTVYGIDDIRNTTAQLAANGVPNYDELAEAAGNLNAVAGGNAETYKSVAMALTQTAGAGKLTTENWNQLADAIPGASGKLQEAMLKNGAYTGNFRDAMANGEITAQEFNDALMQLGMDDVAKKAAESTQTFEGAFGNLEATIVDGAANIVNTVKPALTGAVTFVSDKLQSFFGWFTKAFQGVIDLVGNGDFTSAFREAFNVEEDSPLVDMLLSMRDTAIDVFTTVKQRVTDFVTAFQNTGAVQSMAEALGHVWDACKSVIDAVKSIYDNLGILGGAMGDASGMGDLLGNAFKDAGKVVQVAADALKAISDWCSQNAALVTSALVGIGAGFAVFKIASIISTVVSALQGFSAAATAASIAQTLLNVAMNANPIMLVVTAIAAVVAGLIWFFTQTEEGKKAWSSFTGFLQSAWQKITDFFQKTWESIVKWFTDAGTNIRNTWNAVTGFISSIPGRIQGFFAGIGAWFVGKFNEVKNGIQTAFNNAVQFISSIPGRIQGFFAGIGSWFVGKFNEVRNGVVNGFNAAVDWVRGVPGRITGFFGSIGAWFGQKFEEVRNGISDGFNSAVDFVSSIPGRILDALGNLGGLLWDAGASIMQGFLDGLKSIWNNITGFVGDIAGWIADHKGPLSYDRRLLIPAGTAIMGGFRKSLNAGWAKVQADINSMNTGLASWSPAVAYRGMDYSGYEPAMAGTSNVQITNYYPQADPWPLTTNSSLDRFAYGI